MPDYLEDRHGGGDAYLGTPHHWTSEYSVEVGVIQAALEMYVATDQRCLYCTKPLQSIRPRGSWCNDECWSAISIFGVLLGLASAGLGAHESRAAILRLRGIQATKMLTIMKVIVAHCIEPQIREIVGELCQSLGKRNGS